MAQQEGKKVVAISGGFDPIQDGHIAYMEEALTLGDFLLVILTRDDQLISKKGKCWIPFERRRYMLEWILQGKGKDFMVVSNIDHDITSRQSLKMYLPIHIFAKGGDAWDADNLPERKVCEELGIKIIFGIGGFNKDRGSSDVKDWEKENI